MGTRGFTCHIVRQLSDLENRHPPLQLVGRSICQEPLSELSPRNHEETCPTLETGMPLGGVKMGGGPSAPLLTLGRAQAEGALGTP